MLPQQLQFRLRMYPKKLTERLERLDKVKTSNLRLARHVDGQNYHPEHLSEGRQMGIRESANELGIYTDNMEQRDHYMIIAPPNLPTDQVERQREIKLWLGDVCKRTFSISFKYFLDKVFDTQTTKSFCSECFIGNLITLSRHNKLTPEDYQLINCHMRDELLPYFLLRYPQSNNKQVNQNLNKQISSTDSLQNNENNLFLKSGIHFKYRQKGTYFDQIMQFLNYVLTIPEKQISPDSGITMFDCFNNKMEKLFKSVESRMWTETNLYDEYLDSDQTVEQLKDKMEKLEIACQDEKIIKSEVIEILNDFGGGHRASNKMGQLNDKFSKKQYQDQVKEYTSYAINTKISKNVPKYTSDHIRHNTIKMPSSSVLRIIVKWCGELEEKFVKSEYFNERDEPFVLQNGQEVQMKDEYRNRLCIYANEEWAEIQKLLREMQKDNYEKQAALSFKNLMYFSKQSLPQFEESLIKFSNRNTESVNHYAITYLNRLIHGLLKISKKIYQTSLIGSAQWPEGPQLLTFFISDLMRCKVYSKEKEIIRIYKEIELQSIVYPEQIKIIRVKNRLNRGTKDILINVLLKEESLCEIQLAIKNQLSPFILHSDKFNHYVYQLKRSIFGPVSEMCSIWSSLDERSDLFQEIKVWKPKIEHACPQPTLVSEILPFTCSVCYNYYSNQRFIFAHIKCSKCNQYRVCAKCRLKTMSEAQIFKSLNLDQKEAGRMITDFTILPRTFISLQYESLQISKRKYRIFQFDHTVFFVRRADNNKTLRVKSFKKDDQKSKNEFLSQYLFFQLIQPDPELEGINEQQVIDEACKQEILGSYKKKSQAIRITKKNISTDLILSIDDSRSQSLVTTFSFPENNISNVKRIAQKFINVKILNLDKNNVKSLEGIGKMTKLTDLYLQRNQFTEIVQLDKLKRLNYIQLGNNSKAPVFKCNLSGLVQLQNLTFNSSNLPVFPEQICYIPNLKLLWLDDNLIETIPAAISNLKHMQNLVLAKNKISALPKQLFDCKNLTNLSLENNKIKQIPVQICNLTKLKILRINNNPIEKMPSNVLLTEAFKQINSISLDEATCRLIQDILPNPIFVVS